MSVEGGGILAGGSIGGGIGSGVATLGGGGAGIGLGSIGEVGAMRGGLSNFGVEMTAPLTIPVSEGLAPRSFLKNTMPLTINDLGLIKGAERFDIGINFPVQESELNSNDAIFEAESILLRASPQSIGEKTPSVFDIGLSDVNLDSAIEPEPILLQDILLQDILTPVRIQVSDITQDSFPVTLNLPANASVALPAGKPSAMPMAARQAGHSEGYKLYPSPPEADQDDRGAKLDCVPALQRVTTPFLEPVTEVATATRLGIQPQTVTITQPIIETRLEEQIVEDLAEEVQVVNKSEIEEKEGENEQSEELKLKRIVDEEAAKVRIGEIIEAAKTLRQAQGEEEEIDGKKIVENLPGQHAKNRSGELNIVDPRGYLFDGSLFATIAKIASRKFSSLSQVYKKASEIVYEDIPVTRGEGKSVTDEDVLKVYKDHKGKVPPALEVLKRVIKIKKLVKIQSQGSRYNQAVEIEKKEEDESEGRIGDNLDLAQALKADLP